MADADTRLGRGYGTPELLQWLQEVHASHDSALAAAFDAPRLHGVPAIQVAASEGRFLQLLMQLVGARRVVEIGTLAGYSAIWIGRGLAAGGRLWTLEQDPAHADVAESNLAAAGLGDRVTVCRGPALEMLPTLEGEGPFDAVFIDADKGCYDRYGQWARRNLRVGGLLVGDNAFLFGRLLARSDEAAAMRRFHEEAAAHFAAVCLPTPDGLLLGVKND